MSEIRLLAKEVKNIKNMEVVKIFNHPWRFLSLALMKGIMVGFGSVLGATVFLSIFVYLLAQISFVPVIGDFVGAVMEEIEERSVTQDKKNDPAEIFEQYHRAKEEAGKNT